MDEIQKVARAYFDGKTEDEKECAREFFASLDENGDGKVSWKEYKKQVDSSFCSQQIFLELDKNGDGTLDFDEVLTLYYMNNVSIPRCGGCHVMLLSSSYFSCLRCLGQTSYHLCCSCYAGGNFRHLHSSNEFSDTRAQLRLVTQLLTDLEVAFKEEEEEVGEGSNSELSSPTPTRSKTSTVVRTVAICATRAVIIKGAVVVAASAGCCIM